MKQIFIIGLCVFVVCSVAPVQADWMPDPNLRQAVREALNLPDDTPLTQLVMNQLIGLDADDSQITDLTGLEHAINLTWLSVGGNEIRNLRPLAVLNQLETLSVWVNPISDISPLTNLVNLKALDLGGCRISDLRPLANLMGLERLNLRYNFDIEDITPLVHLKNLTELSLSHNRIIDVSPLANLTNLKKLWLHNNKITDHSPLDALSLTIFEYDESCVLPSLPIHERIENRRFPSIFSAWGGIGWSSVLNLPEKSDLEQMALHDLYFCCLIFWLEFRDTPEGKRVMGDMTQAIELRDAHLALNPNMLFIAALRMREAYPTSHPEDSPYWLRDENGERVFAWTDGPLFLDFTKPIVIDKIVEEAIAVSKCGLYDGIFFDWWNEWYVILDGSRTNAEEQAARDQILRRIRAEVPEDFLILVNGNRNKMPRTGWAINGTFMETLRDHDKGYTYGGLAEIESTLHWAEENLREPRINCLEGWGVPTESPDSPRNLRWMRAFTTMSLTHSDGYVLYNDGIQHEHYWYDFWDADLGQPIGEKAQRYENREGLFIREFTNGWAVYNRSGTEQRIELPEKASGVANGLTGTAHTIPDLDGEIYLKQETRPSMDVNGDGVVNILDLVAVANGFGTDAPDVNGDGVVNILDLVQVANQFGQ